MPFTFAHPAIILPLVYWCRRWFSLTGLVVGSIVPDFEYFLRMKPTSVYSHTFSGVFMFDLPLGILISFVFHNIVRKSLIQNLPLSLQQRLVNFDNFDWNTFFRTNWLKVTFSILIGAASHIFWDNFTHETGIFVNSIQQLKFIVDFHFIKIPIYKLLQHGSTIIGFLIISYAIYKLPKVANPINIINRKYWTVILIIILFIIAAKILTGVHIAEYGNIIVSAISAFLIALIATPLILKK